MIANMKRERGASLLEVLISVLIFAIGLLGVAGLLVMATRANHGGYLRTQVTHLAQSMGDRMAANPIGVWEGHYDSSSYPLPAGGMASCGSGCTPAQLAAYDKRVWSSQLNTFLPDPSATIECSRSGVASALTANHLKTRPPFGGSCTMTISWSDRGLGSASDRAAQQETFAWEFQP